MVRLKKVKINVFRLLKLEDRFDKSVGTMADEQNDFVAAPKRPRGRPKGSTNKKSKLNAPGLNAPRAEDQDDDENEEEAPPVPAGKTPVDS